MSNMSYCRFQNTLHDLRDCGEHLSDKLGEDEARARKQLILVCVDILEELKLLDGALEEVSVETAIDKTLAAHEIEEENKDEDE